MCDGYIYFFYGNFYCNNGKEDLFTITNNKKKELILSCAIVILNAMFRSYKVSVQNDSLKFYNRSEQILVLNRNAW